MPKGGVSRYLLSYLIIFHIISSLCYATSVFKFVLTGGPNVGKSTLLEALGKEGFQIIPESARELIKKAKNAGRPKPAHNENLVEQFQKDLFRLQTAKENQCNKGLIFLDRCLIDGLAFCTYYNIQPPEGLLRTIQQTNYEIVFLIDSLEPLIRYKDPDMGKRLHELLTQIYQEYGYTFTNKKLIRVPAFLFDEQQNYLSLQNSVQKRVNFILERIATYKADVINPPLASA